MAEERRGSERYARRVEVRFWRAGSTQSHTGFTTNVSTSGLFLGTTHTLKPGERLRVELPDRAGSFILEAQVARVHRVSLSLRHVEQPGAGIRFLTPPELVAALIPAARQTGGEGHEQAAERAAGPSPARGAATGRASPSALAPEASAPAPSAAPLPPAAASPPAAPTSPETGGLPVVVVEFGDRMGFLSVYHRDLAAGSLHVSSDVPVRLHESIVVEIRPPLPGHPPLRFEATVVHRFEPRAAVGKGSNVLAGMGVRFRDPERVREALAPILAELRR